MDHHRNVPLRQAHCLSSFGVLDAIHDLHFQKVVAAAQRAALIRPATERPLRKEIRPSIGNAAAGLGRFDVRLPAQATPDHERRTVCHELDQLPTRELDPPAAPDAAGHLGEQLVDELFDTRLDIIEREVGADQAYAAVNIVTHTAGRDHAALVRVGRRHAADAEAVAPVNVRHGQRVPDDAGQRGDVGDLLGRLVLLDGIDQPLVGVNQAVHAHVRAVRLWNAPAVVINALQWSSVVVCHDQMSTMTAASKPPRIWRMSSS